MRKLNTESGFGLLNVLVVLAVVLVGILLLSKSQVNLRMASQSLDSANSYEAFISSFTDFVHKSVKDNIAQLCAGQTTAVAGLNFAGKKAGYANQITLPGSTAAINELRNRCKQPLLGADGRLYFCLQLEQNSAYAKDGFAGAENNVAEIAVRAVDKWQQPINCATYQAATQPDVGLQIYYRLHWMIPAQKDRLYQKYGYFYGIKE